MRSGPVGRRALGWALIVLCLGVGLFWFHSGTTLGGLDPPSSQCAASVDVPTEGGPYYEDATVTGAATYFPLGMICIYDSPNDSVGPQTVDHQNWVETVVCLISVLGLGWGFWLAIGRNRIAG